MRTWGYPVLLIILLIWASQSRASVCAQGGTTPGVDVSNYQLGIQWSQTSQAGKKFAFIKATEGLTLVNQDFSKDWSSTKAAGILRGAYHFFVPSDDPNEQAQHFLSQLGSSDDSDLPPLFDWETTDNLPNDEIIARAQVFLNAVETATGRTPVIYTNPGYWQALGNPAGFDQYPLFIADYGVNCPEVPAPWNTWTFWQKSISQVPGIKGSSDQDVFNGILSDLNQFLMEGFSAL